MGCCNRDAVRGEREGVLVWEMKVLDSVRGMSGRLC